jgi:hypothetical protein
MPRPAFVLVTLGCLAGLAWPCTLRSSAAVNAPAPATSFATGDYVVLSWNDLGMHCMNLSHQHLSVLPPFNNLFAQVVRRGDASTTPVLAPAGVTVEYSVPGNTTSVTKVDFWTWAPQLFGVNLPPDIGLTGKGLSGTLDPEAAHFVARGIPLTPFPDATPAVEDPYQQALVIVRDPQGVELARSTPVVPVSIEMGCVSAGCHASETAILAGHETVPGFDPAAGPILCGGCHADPALGTTGDPEAGYFSFRMHDQHKFLDEQLSGTAECYTCHPGSRAQCLRGAMSHRWGLTCQDCHGNMRTMSNSIENGRVPWVNEPTCRQCHAARFGEPSGTLFRESAGHGGVMCEGCHNSTHADVPTQVPADNANNLALQGSTGVLADCTVCHRVNPEGPGPHGMLANVGVEEELLAGAGPMRARPNPMGAACTIEFATTDPGRGRLVVYDMQGRIVRLLRPSAAGGRLAHSTWDGTDQRGARAEPGVYFVRWLDREASAATRVVLRR